MKQLKPDENFGLFIGSVTSKAGSIQPMRSRLTDLVTNIHVRINYQMKKDELG